MSEKVYRIKPLVWMVGWSGSTFFSDTVFGRYWSRHLRHGTGPNGERFRSRAAAQRDYEASLVAAGVLEEVPNDER